MCLTFLCYFCFSGHLIRWDIKTGVMEEREFASDVRMCLIEVGVNKFFDAVAWSEDCGENETELFTCRGE